jgi:hypothetical protein
MNGKQKLYGFHLESEAIKKPHWKKLVKDLILPGSASDKLKRKLLENSGLRNRVTD